MKKEYSTPEFELFAFRFSDILSGEVVVSDPQLPSDGYDPGELD